ncbi:hypothetical protein H6P81_007914 [Aristolochia fimbriata]|uniref:DinB family protein n=1 Tax=Aristolochia fimbriata TaxID=158543 RepID=A0AAV7F1J6_ARIFI|nr:hypothetical protein H6P81_007914 [Aristolochia fimbriata]
MTTLPRTTERTLVEAALEVLNAADPVEKARLGEAAALDWSQGVISVTYHESADLPVPDRPAQALRPILPPNFMIKCPTGALSSPSPLPSQDIIARFGKRECMPREFFTDFVNVARHEGRHFTLLSNRLQELGSYYGALPAHDGLWDSATTTSGNLLARLAVEHCVHEVTSYLD